MLLLEEVLARASGGVSGRITIPIPPPPVINKENPMTKPTQKKRIFRATTVPFLP